MTGVQTCALPILVIAANFAFARLNKREETPIEEKVEDMRKVVEAYDDLQDEINIAEKDWIEDWPSDNDEELESPYKSPVKVPLCDPDLNNLKTLDWVILYCV